MKHGKLAYIREGWFSLAISKGYGLGARNKFWFFSEGGSVPTNEPILPKQKNENHIPSVGQVKSYFESIGMTAEQGWPGTPPIYYLGKSYFQLPEEGHPEPEEQIRMLVACLQHNMRHPRPTTREIWACMLSFPDCEG